MAFHHKIQPHHHVSIWAISALLLITMATFYNDALLTSAEGNGDQGQNRPSEKTRQFFGENGNDSGPDNSTPAECEQKKDDSDMRSRIDEDNQIRGQISQLEQQVQSAGSGQQAAMSAQIEQLKTRAKELEASFPAQGGQRQESGPSDACKQAIVKKEKDHFTNFKSKINNNILPSFNKIYNLVDKIEKKLPALKSSGVEQTKIDQIEVDLAAIKSDATVVKAFFQEMLNMINQFEASANDPNTAFDKMKNGFDSKKSTASANAANDLVAKFEDLQKIIQSIKE